MLELVKLLRPKVYVELGVQRGFTFNQVAPLVLRAVAVDVKILPSIVRAPNVECYELSTVQFAEMWHEDIDMLFVDADHKKDSVIADVTSFLQFVKIGSGIICLHDTHPGTEELMSDKFCSSAWEAADWLTKSQKELGIEIVTIPSPHYGITIIRRMGIQHLAWKCNQLQ